MHLLVAGLLCIAAAVAQIPPAPGAMVEIGGRSMHLHCTGKGSPVVIFESGFPGSSLDWTLVQPEVAPTTRVCSYDRAGLGWSDLPAAPPASGFDIVEDLKKLLAAAPVEPPYVLVGQSLGGIYVRMFAAKYPAEVVGMVLVDSSHEDQWDYKPVRKWTPASPAAALPAKPDVVHPEPARSILASMWKTEQWKTAAKRESSNLKAVFEALSKMPKRLPVIPLVVLTAGGALGAADVAEDDAWKWQQLQRELAALSPLGEWAPVSGANHYIQLSKPEAVIAAIRKVVGTARGWKRLPEGTGAGREPAP